MPKYIKRQTQKNTCGPVAIVNVLRSFGLKISYAQVLKECGGLKKVSKRGIPIPTMIRVLKKHNIEPLCLHLHRKKMLKYAAHPKASVLLAYAWIKKVRINGRIRYGGGGHVVMIQKNGKALNVSSQSSINGQRWRDTKTLWGIPPVTIVCVEKPGGVK